MPQMNVDNLQKYIDFLAGISHWLRFLFTPLALFFLVFIFWNSKEIIYDLLKNSNLILVFLSIFLWVLLHFLSPVFTVFLFRCCHLSLNYQKAFLIHSSRLPAKYLPGGIWHTVARGKDYSDTGLSFRNISSYFLIENLIIASTTLTFASTIIIYEGTFSHLFSTIIKSIAITGVCFLFILPKFSEKYLFDHKQPWDKVYYFYSIALMLAYWTVVALTFICFIKAFAAISLNLSDITIGAIYIFSWGIGFITIFAPQGIGVTELVAANLLGDNTTINALIFVISSFRVVILAGDFLTWALSRALTARFCLS